MRFEVPQFIDVEDKIFGPLTFKQFAYVAGGVGFIVILYTMVGLVFAILLGSPMLILGLALAFFKVNNRPFSEMVRSFLLYATNRKLYLWKHQPKQVERKETQQEEPQERPALRTNTQSKLKDIAWSLDMKESMYENMEQVK
ncbi:hypothetical protein GVX82_03610 [Patescibacteria group bacterium]|jgi:hypothetical protein|nr:hypothetical protein [Patescibacteria group bacterium]NBD74100.1 hypothetical protein [Patescibacteria group bacterium]